MKTLKKILSNEPEILTLSRYCALVFVRVKGGSIMTANQVAYQQQQEAKRHNVAMETIERVSTQAQKKRLEEQTDLDRRRHNLQQRQQFLDTVMGIGNQIEAHRANTIKGLTGVLK